MAVREKTNQIQNITYEEGVLPYFRAVGHGVARQLASHSAVACGQP